MSHLVSGAGVLINSESIATPWRDEILKSLKKCTRPPRLVGILSTASGPSNMYAEFTRKTCEELQIEFILRKVGAALNEDEADAGDVEEAIIECNQNPDVDGIMVYYPIFGPQQDHYLQQIVAPAKDVEGLHFKFHYNLYHNIRFIDPRTLNSQESSDNLSAAGEVINPPPGYVKSILPCTPLAIVKTLEHLGVYNCVLKYGDRAYGRVITVINRSEVVGRPLAALLANDGARVFSVDIDSIMEYTKRPPGTDNNKRRQYHPRHVVHATKLSLEQVLSLSDVVISAVPSKEYKVKTDWLKDGSICINVASEKNFEKNVREKASMYLPSIGKVTILMLLRNLIRMQHEYQC